VARILFLTQVLPYPLNAGPKVRAYHMLRHLAGQHDITLVSFIRPDDSADAIAHLGGICRDVHTVPMQRSTWRNLKAGGKGLLTGLPIVMARDEIEDMQALVRRLASSQSFDIVHADQLSMSAYGLLAAQAGALPALLDEHNAIYLLAQRMIADERNWARRVVMAREAKAFARYEARTCQAYDAVLTVTSEDREHLLALYAPEQRAALRDKFTVVPISVDPDEIRAVAHRPSAVSTIVHVGTMFWPPNVAGVLWFAREVLPLIHQRLPDARFVVVGKAPPPEVQALASDPRIAVTGYVAELEPYLAEADAFVVPLHAGGGMRVKILDAWLWGLPIVSTPIGAEGIELRDGENIMLAENAPVFADTVVRLLTDEGLNQRLRTAGRAWVEETYAWRGVYRRADQVYAKLLATTQTSDRQVITA
jgi:glycosyltransferase involved in cell wall biosynthesis